MRRAPAWAKYDVFLKWEVEYIVFLGRGEHEEYREKEAQLLGQSFGNSSWTSPCS